MKYKNKKVPDWKCKQYARYALYIVAAILLIMAIAFGVPKI